MYLVMSQQVIVTMDKYYNNIKTLIENNIVEVKKQEISVNNHTLMTYFNVGKEIVEAQGGEKRAKYGNGLIKEYSKKLAEEFGKFYSEKNLRNMRQFYLTFKKWNSLSSKLSWTHYRYILPIKNESKRNYYINLAIENRLSVRELTNEIKNNSYERLIGDKDNIELKYGRNSRKRF